MATAPAYHRGGRFLPLLCGEASVLLLTLEADLAELVRELGGDARVKIADDFKIGVHVAGGPERRAAFLRRQSGQLAHYSSGPTV